MIAPLSRRGVLTGIGAGLVPGACHAQPGPDALTPERFGAKGDGVTNDTDAFAALAAEVMRRGGGEVSLRRTTYLVGRQRRTPGSPGWYLEPAPIFAVSGLAGPLKIAGNGATLRCGPGLRYGSFDPATRRKLEPRGANLDKRTIATPYQAMISIERCRGPVEIADLELDGNSPALIVGGPYGDVGIQISGTGIGLFDNRGDEILRRITSRRHPLDGIMIGGLSSPPPGTRRIAEDVTCDLNGRQGCSIVGGRGWRFARSTFSRAGRGPIMSPPGAGVDIEAEGGRTNRDHAFADCAFVDNAGVGLVADTGDSADLSFTRCRFVGTTAPSLWPAKPGMRFADCRIVGTVVACYGGPDLARATQFSGCLFTDDPALSPTRKVYRQDRADGSLADLATAQNVLFDHCRFLAVGGATLPWSTGAIYRDCIMRQTGRSQSFPRGRFEGRNVLDGPIDVTGSRVAGQLLVNGRPLRRN